jgi:fused signal recognition particle receptor
MDNTTALIVVGVALAVLIVVGLLLWARRRRARRETVSTLRPLESHPSRLGRSAMVLGAALRRAWASGLDERTWDGLEEALLAADVGVESTSEVVSGVKAAGPETPEQAREVLSRLLRAELGDRDREIHLTGSPAVILVVGVNGTGKTTTIAKLSNRLLGQDRRVVIAAAETFRAAAGAQLERWGERLGVEVISGQEGGDPAAVAFDAIGSARAKGADVVIVDTAGRLHAKKNLMAELSKIHRVAAGDRSEVDEVLLVLDATGGQNGVTQVREFANAVPITGIVLTKLDGTAKGGIVIAVERQLGVPVKFVGLGEGIDDLLPFDPDSFVADLLEQS